VKENETIYLKNIVCQLHKVENGSTGVTIHGDLRIPVNNMFINFQLFHKTSDRQLFNISFDYCSFYNNLPPFIDVIFDSLREFSSNLIHACPYSPQNELGVKNLPASQIGTDLLSKFQVLFIIRRGEYSSSTFVTDKKGRLIFYFKCIVVIAPKRGQKKG